MSSNYIINNVKKKKEPKGNPPIYPTHQDTTTYYPYGDFPYEYTNTAPPQTQTQASTQSAPTPTQTPPQPQPNANQVNTSGLDLNSIMPMLGGGSNPLGALAPMLGGGNLSNMLGGGGGDMLSSLAPMLGGGGSDLSGLLKMFSGNKGNTNTLSNTNNIDNLKKVEK